ncbi:MAG: class I SAM-dependent methyltransferase [Pseudomonadota bacterium]
MTHKDFDFDAELDACPACGGKVLRPAPVSLDDDWSLAGFKASKCVSCRTVFFNPRPLTKALGAFYAAIDKGDPRGFIEASLRYYRDPARAAARRREYLAPLLRRRASGALLDFGCGAGWFAKMAEDAGFEAHGLEQMPEAAAAAREELGLVNVRTGGEGELPAEPTYDVIVANNVIEHMLDPADFAGKCFAALKPGGLLMYNFPCADSYMFEALGAHNYYYMAPYHLTHFTREGMSRMLSALGYENIAYESQPEAYYWGKSLAHKLGLTDKYKKWRNDPDFVKFDIAMDELLAAVTQRYDVSLNSLVFAEKV